ATRSNAVGLLINAPKTSSIASPALRNTSGSKCRAVATAFNASATKANEATNPVAIRAGRAPARCPIDAPSRIGSTGNVQGATIVSMPANSASARSVIGVVEPQRAGPNARASLLATALVLLHVVLFHAIPGHRILRHRVLLHVVGESCRPLSFERDRHSLHAKAKN